MTHFQFSLRFLTGFALLAATACATNNGSEPRGSSDDAGSVTTDTETVDPMDTDEPLLTDDTETATATPDSAPDSETDTVPDSDSESDGMITFNTSFGGDLYDIAYTVLQTPDGGYVVAGYSFSFVNDKVEVTDKNFVITNNDALLGKFSRTGQLEWKKSYGDRYPQAATSIAFAPDGGYLMAGESTASFGTVVLNAEVKPGIFEDVEFDKIREDAYLLKVDADGNEEWSFLYGDTYTVEGFDKVIATEDNHYLAVGYRAVFDQDYADEVMAPYPALHNAVMKHYAVKTDLEGTVVWEKSFNAEGRAWDYLTDVVESSTGYVVVGGSLETVLEKRDFYVAELEKDTGELSWEKIHAARKRYTGDDFARTIVPVRNESSEITGYLIAGTQDWGYDTFDRDLFGMIRLLKIDLGGDKTGEWIWDVTGVSDPDAGYLKEGIDMGIDLTETADGKFVLLSVVAYDVFVKYYEECDVHLMKIDENGQVDWERRYGQAKKYDMPAAIQTTADDGFIIVGSTQSFLEPGEDPADDWHLIKTDPQGEI